MRQARSSPLPTYKGGNQKTLEEEGHEQEHSQSAARRRSRNGCLPRLGGRGDPRSARQCRQGAAQLADEPPHLRRPALFAARQDQQGQRQKPQARLCGRHRRHLRQREPAGHAARRGRLPLRRRSVGRGLQDRRALGRHGPHRLAHGPRPGEAAAVEPRRRPVGQPGALHRQLSGPGDRHRQGERQGGVGDQPARPAGRADHRRGAAGEGQDHRRRGRRRPRRARLDRGARRRDRQAPLAQIRDPGARASPAARPGRTRTRSPGRPAAARCGSPAPTIPPPIR